MGCGCLLVLLGSAFPRVALVLTWIFPSRVDIAFDGGVALPLLGLIFLPYTTLFYVLAYAPIVGVSRWAGSSSCSGSCSTSARCSAAAARAGAATPAEPAAPRRHSSGGVSCGLALDLVDDAGVGQRRGVAEVAALGDVAQQAAHDLAAAGLRQLRRQVDRLRLGDGADLLADVVAQRLRRRRRTRRAA